MRSTEPRQPDKHAHGPLTTKTVGARFKETRARIRRWAKRVLRRTEDKTNGHD